MIDNITKGDRIQGLLLYLFGEGKGAEDHVDPRLVAGWEGLVAPEGALAEAEVFALASEMDRPRQLHQVEVASNYVWHCSLANHVEDRPLTDAQWGRIAREVIEEMGFADCRWVAVRHADNHVHLAVTRVTEAGTVVNLHNDYGRMKAICARLEVEFGMERTPDRSGVTRGVSQAELDRAERAGHTETAREGLARKLRVAATVARSEAEFVTRVRQDGLGLHARRDTQARVVGYAVCDPSLDNPLWYSGRTLSPDLSLPRLRQRWAAIDQPDQPDPPTQAAQAAQAAGEAPGWPTPPQQDDDRAVEEAGDGGRWPDRPPVPAPAPNPPRQMLREEAWDQAHAVLEDADAAMAGVPASDTGTWTQAAAEVAGLLAAVAGRWEEPGRPGSLSRAATALAREAQTDRMSATGYAPPLRSMYGVSRVAADALISSSHGVSGMAVLMDRVERMLGRISDARRLEATAAQYRQTAQAHEALRAWLRNPLGPLPPEAALVVPPNARAHHRHLQPGQQTPTPPPVPSPATSRRRLASRREDHDR